MAGLKAEGAIPYSSATGPETQSSETEIEPTSPGRIPDGMNDSNSANGSVSACADGVASAGVSGAG